MFTREQIEEIRQKLALSGFKDTELPLADLPLKGNEIIAIVQNGSNKYIPIEEFFESSSENGTKGDLFNVSEYIQALYQLQQSVPMTLEEAIEACPDIVKRGGQILTFLDSDTHEWVVWQYQSDNNSNWNIRTNWNMIMASPYIDPVTKHWVVNETDTGISAEGPKGDPVHLAIELDAMGIGGEGEPSATIEEVTLAEEGYDQKFKITVANLRGEQGKSAYEVWLDENDYGANEHPVSEYLDWVQATLGGFIYTVYDSQASQTIGGTPFAKFHDGGGADELQASLDTLDKIVVMPDDDTDPTATIMYVTEEIPGTPITYQFVCVGTLNIDASTFVKQSQIDNTGLMNPQPNDVAKATDVMNLNDYVNPTVSVDFTKLTKYPGGINNNSNWIIGETAKHYEIDVTDIKYVHIIANGGYYCFLTEHVDNPVQGQAAPIIGDRVGLAVNQDVTFTIPNGAVYLFILATSSSGDVTPSLCEYKKNLNDSPRLLNADDLDNLNEQIEDIDNSINDIVFQQETNIEISTTPCGYFIDSNNLWKIGSELVKGTIIPIPLGYNSLKFTSNNERGNIIALLSDNTIVPDSSPNFAQGYSGRISIIKNETAIFKLDASCKYLYYNISIRSGGAVPQTIKFGIDFVSNSQSKKHINFLVIGSSGDQEIMAYVPSIIKTINQSDINYSFGVAYASGAQADYYVNKHNSHQPAATYYSEWTYNDSKWTKITATSQLYLTAILQRREWDIVLFKGKTISDCRELMRIVQLNVNHPVSFVTNLNYSKSTYSTYEVDSNGNPLYDTEDLFETNYMPLRENMLKKTGFFDLVAVGTAIQNARTNSILKQYGAVFPYEQTYTIAANSEVVVSNAAIKINDKIRLYKDNIGTTVKFLYGTNYSNEITIETSPITYTAIANSTNTVGFKITNSGDSSVNVTVRMYATYDNYLLNDDNTHLQSGFALLLCSYVVAIKLLEWSGYRYQSIGGCKFVPTDIVTGDINCDYMIHGDAMGVSYFADENENIYTKDELTLVDGDYYLTSSLDGGSVTVDSIRVNEIPLWDNIHAAQEIAMIATANPFVVTDCGNDNNVWVTN